MRDRPAENRTFVFGLQIHSRVELSTVAIGNFPTAGNGDCGLPLINPAQTRADLEFALAKFALVKERLGL